MLRFLIALGMAACAVTPVAPPEDPGENVILVTLDGVRSDEMFALERLYASLGTRGVLYEHMTTANDAQVSLPGYMSIFAGFAQRCYDNQCPRTAVETVLERVLLERGFDQREVAAIGSSARMGRALEQVPGRITTDLGNDPGPTPPPWKFNRWDRDTFARAMTYLRAERPRLLYIALGDSDSWAHLREYERYVGAIRQYDLWIDELVRELDGMGDYGRRTTVIVTTDHGRGDGELWDDHNSERPGSERVFLYALGPHVVPGLAASHQTHADIRPTLETLFGLEVMTCDLCGHPLAEVVGGKERP